MAKSNAAKRLERILADEDYGPKLARMNRRNESYILDLIDRNKGREARREILRLDEVRRTQRRERDRQRRASTSVSVSDLRQQAARNIIRRTKGHPGRIQRNVHYMTRDELRFAILASSADLRARAQDAPYVESPEFDKPINPFWYH